MTGPKFVITLSTSCTEVIIVCICSVFQNATLPSISITVNPSIMVAVLHAYLYNLYLIFFGLLARRIKALTIFSIMMKPNSSRWFLCGVPAPVYSKLVSIFQSFPFPLTLIWNYIQHCRISPTLIVVLFASIFWTAHRLRQSYHYLPERNMITSSLSSRPP